MSDKKKSKQKNIEETKVTKEEYAVAKYLRFALPVREGKMHGMEVKCFIANAAIDSLLESKWCSSKNKSDPIFTNRASCILYMNVLLEKGLFHRADRDRSKKDKDSTKKKKKEKESEKEDQSKDEDLRQRKSKKEKKSKKEERSSAAEKNKDDTTDNKEEKKKDDKEKKKKERRFKLLMSDDQWFEDGDEVYVWIYDPVNVKNFLIGLLMVLGAIGLCMFPLWPEGVRIGVYYLSLSAAAFVGFILFLAVVRLILFCCVWALTMGRHHFWFLPNLTEDVGFFDSFRPLYKHDVVSRDEESDTGKKKKKKTDGKQEKIDSTEQKEKSSDKDDSDEFEVIKNEDLDENKDEEQGKEEEEEDNENSIDEDEEEEEDLKEDESEDIDEEDAQSNSSSEKEDKKTK